MGDKQETHNLTIHGSIFRDTPNSVKVTRLLHRILPVSAQRSFRDGAFRSISDCGVAVAAGVSAVFRPRLAARFLSVGRKREDHKYGAHPRQVIEVVQATTEGKEASVRGGREDEKPKLIVFVHGGAWGSGSTWMYRLLVDRLSQLQHPHPRLEAYTVASVGYRVHPDADTIGQVEDLAEAVRWMSGNVDLMGFDREPEVYLMGHSSGAHISLLYLVREAEKKEAAAAAAAASAAGAAVAAAPGAGAPAADPKSPDDASPGLRVEDAVRAAGHGSSTPVGRSGGDGDDDYGACRQLEVEGFIGLAGVYDVHRHYLYESWRGVHEISPMKAANGGMLHTLFDFSYPHLLRAKPLRPQRSWSRTTIAPPTPRQPPHPANHRHGAAVDSNNNYPASSSTLEDIRVERGRYIDAASHSAFDGDDSAARRAIGRRLPRTLLVHGTADATVPFSQTAALAAALRTLGVPTVVRFDPGGDHFGVVGQLMFDKESLVETAISHFTSQTAKQVARRERAINLSGGHALPEDGHLHSRL